MILDHILSVGELLVSGVLSYSVVLLVILTIPDEVDIPISYQGLVLIDMVDDLAILLLLQSRGE